MTPHIICHMLSSVDGRIDGEALETVTAEGEYEATAAQLGGDAWICGRTTMQRHFAEDEPFISGSNAPARAPAGLRRPPGGLLRRLGGHARQAALGQRQPRRRPPHLRFERAGPGRLLGHASGERRLLCGLRRVLGRSGPSGGLARRALRHPHAAARRRRPHQRGLPGGRSG
jgi:hypothetical protein